jgi:carbon monoxide dehydrogenase subunit G
MTGEQLIAAPQQATWEALNNPDVLKACVPGCESITLVNANEYQVLMTAKVGPVSAKSRGRLSLSDIKPPHSYSLAFEGQGGAAGFAKGGAQVRLSPEKDQTRLAYDVKANVGGKLAQIGSRLVESRRRVLPELQQADVGLRGGLDGSHPCRGNKRCAAADRLQHHADLLRRRRAGGVHRRAGDAVRLDDLRTTKSGTDHVFP